jgi:hypothetical protein
VLMRPLLRPPGKLIGPTVAHRSKPSFPTRARVPDVPRDGGDRCTKTCRAAPRAVRVSPTFRRARIAEHITRRRRRPIPPREK